MHATVCAQVRYTLSLPYVDAVQVGGLHYPVNVWYDASDPSKTYTRVDVYGGLDSTLMLPVGAPGVSLSSPPC